MGLTVEAGKCGKPKKVWTFTSTTWMLNAASSDTVQLEVDLADQIKFAMAGLRLRLSID